MAHTCDPSEKHSGCMRHIRVIFVSVDSASTVTSSVCEGTNVRFSTERSVLSWAERPHCVCSVVILRFFALFSTVVLTVQQSCAWVNCKYAQVHTLREQQQTRHIWTLQTQLRETGWERLPSWGKKQLAFIKPAVYSACNLSNETKIA